MDENMQRLEDYIGALRTKGVGLPSQDAHEAPRMRAISAAAGVDFRYIIKEPYRQRVLLAVEELGLAPKEGTRASRSAATFLQNRAKLDNYFQWLKDNAFKLPEDPMHRGRVFWAQVAVEASLSPQGLCCKHCF